MNRVEIYDIVTAKVAEVREIKVGRVRSRTKLGDNWGLILMGVGSAVGTNVSPPRTDAEKMTVDETVNLVQELLAS
ncbi:MAG: hypothetical protein CMI53_02045 [Parcubacteria group bacterium]|nr:hypothetical protein [Parcubacteria group bacterium]|tara:strand:- start:859 stop:1086 length:228 start_codon:yes stop_codon:yes gene_type:complete